MKDNCGEIVEKEQINSEATWDFFVDLCLLKVVIRV